MGTEGSWLHRSVCAAFCCFFLCLLPTAARAADESKTVYRLADSLTAGQTYVIAASNAPGDTYILTDEGGTAGYAAATVMTDTVGSSLDAPDSNALWLFSNNRLQNVSTSNKLGLNTSIYPVVPVLTGTSSRFAYDHGEKGLGVTAQDYWMDFSSSTGFTMTFGAPDTRVWLYEQTAVPCACTDDTVVVDFGLPVDIHVLENDLLPDGAALTGISAGLYGSAQVVDDAVRYTPSMHFSGVETLTYTVSSGHTGTVSIVPASSILYEEDFLTYTDGSAAWETVSAEDGASPMIQREDAPGAGGPYGTDPVYESGLTYTLGSARRASVGPDPTGSWPTAVFSFTGTGFDLISATGRDSGLFVADVTDLNTGETLYRWAVDGYWNAEEPLYQIPVLKSPTLPHSSYRVTLTPIYAAFFDHDDEEGYFLCIDAVRIHTPAQGLDGTYYALDGEGWAQTVDLRDELVRTRAQGGSLLSQITFTGKDMSLFDQCLQPNNEVYLYPEQSLSFELTVPAREGLTPEELQLSCKALTQASSLFITAGERETLWEVSTASPLFRCVHTGHGTEEPITITIANRGTAPVSLTELKFTYREGGDL